VGLGATGATNTGIGSIYAGAPQGIAGATNIGAGISGAGTGGGMGVTAGGGAPVLGGIAAPTTAGSIGGAGAGSIGGAGAGVTGGGAGAGTNIFGQTLGQPGVLTNTQLGMTAGTAGLSGAMQAERSKYGTPTVAPYEGPLSKLKYDPNKFTASAPTYAPASVYRPTYAAEGGIMKLAQGGMPGPVQQMSQNMLGGQGNMYPQSQQEHTNFATPTQMPASAEVIQSDYDAKTNPYTGVMMASGGIAHYDEGGRASELFPTGIANVLKAIKKGKKIDPGQVESAQLQGLTPSAYNDIYGQGIQAQQQMQSQGMAKGGSAGNKNMIAIDDYVAAVKGGDEASVMAKAQAGDYNAMIALNKVQNTPNQNYAMGGHLGGYSDGGRMLKGPGDGMSDNIPATIAGKQAARLADGEFVVPADVVSHLGNGSTDAGAKQLYAMMNRVRKARTGNPKQGKQIKPAKYMAA
jgi:hypothetical protein